MEPLDDYETTTRCFYTVTSILMVKKGKPVVRYLKFCRKPWKAVSVPCLGEIRDELAKNPGVHLFDYR